MIYYAGRHHGNVKVDGKTVFATHCDTKLGYAVAFAFDDKGRLILNDKGTSAKREVVRGRVEFERLK
jgi:hypothetical protein